MSLGAAGAGVESAPGSGPHCELRAVLAQRRSRELWNRPHMETETHWEEPLGALGQGSSHVQKCQCGYRKSLISADGRRWGIWNLRQLLAAEKNCPDGLTLTVVPAA